MKVGVLVASGCDDWCYADGDHVIRTTEVYSFKTGNWSKRADLPVSLNSGQMVMFEGLPTIVDGFNEDTKKSSGDLYQYLWNQDAWIRHPNISLRVPRYDATVFQVPKYLFGLC